MYLLPGPLKPPRKPSTFQMEDMSRLYMLALASRAGYFSMNGPDYGSDLLIRRADYSVSRKREYLRGKAIDLQLKATHEGQVPDLADGTKPHFKFKLEAKNYGDLVDRSNERGKFIPLLLIIFILPDRFEEWTHFRPNLLILRRCAYFYEIPPNTPHTTNTTSVTIKVPKTNIVTTAFFDEQFAKLF